VVGNLNCRRVKSGKEALFTSSLIVIRAVVRRMISFTTAPGGIIGEVEGGCIVR
jgi:hypothetical protein